MLVFTKISVHQVAGVTYETMPLDVDAKLSAARCGRYKITGVRKVKSKPLKALGGEKWLARWPPAEDKRRRLNVENVGKVPPQDRFGHQPPRSFGGIDHQARLAKLIGRQTDPQSFRDWLLAGYETSDVIETINTLISNNTLFQREHLLSKKRLLSTLLAT